MIQKINIIIKHPICTIFAKIREFLIRIYDFPLALDVEIK